MGLLDAFQDSTDTALGVMAARPAEPEQPKPKRSAWTTIPRAIAAAAGEVAGGALDLASAYGQVQAAYGADPFAPEKRKERLEIADKLKADGIDWRTDESRPLYEFSRDLRPDPKTAGAAETIVFGLTKGLTKAIGLGLALGPAAGAAVFGASEGAVTAEDLAVQGVDFETRAKAGAVVGAISGAGMALPVAGKTLAETAALVAVGGPASFIAQQAATRKILENADYGAIAEQFDPLDPVGLTLSTLLPAGFAAWAKGGQIRAAFSKPGKANAAPDVAPPEAAPAKAPTQEQMDAAMVHNLTVARDAHGDPETANAAIARIMQDAEAERAVRAADESEISVSKTVEEKPGLQNPLYRSAIEAMANETGWAEVGGRIIRDPQSGQVTGRSSWVPRAEWWPGRPKDLSEAKAQKAISKALSGEPLKPAEQRLIDYMLGYANERIVPALRRIEGIEEAERARMANDLMAEGMDGHIRDIADNDTIARAAKIDEGALEKAAIRYENDREAFMREAERIVDEHAARQQDAGATPDGRSQADQPAPRSTAAATARPADTEATGVAADTGAQPAVKDPHIASLLSRVEDLNARQPDMPVALREDGTHGKLADELDAIRREAKEGTDAAFGADDAPLLKIAAECFLAMGAAA